MVALSSLLYLLPATGYRLPTAYYSTTDASRSPPTPWREACRRTGRREANPHHNHNPNLNTNTNPNPDPNPNPNPNQARSTPEKGSKGAPLGKTR